MKIAIVIDSFDIINDNSLAQDFGSKLDHDELMLELRIDKDIRLLDNFENIKEKYNLETILTLRSKNEGGEFDGDREEIISQMMKKETDYIDFEFDRDIEYMKNLDNEKITPILSKHNLKGNMLNELNSFITKSKKFHNRNDIIIKFVGKPLDTVDMLKSIDISSEVYKRKIILGIGINGEISRVRGAKLNQEFVYGSITEGIGILKAKELLDTQKNNNLICGLIGGKLGHSQSPLLHKIFRKQLDIFGFYHLLEIKNIGDLEYIMDKLKLLSFNGVNVTFPFKNKIKSNLNSVNTIKYDNLEIKHYNTDISGFKKFYEFHVEPDHSNLNKFLIFGGGGASISICKALLDLGKEVIIVNRTNINDKWPKSLISQVKYYTLDNYELNENIDIYINATTLGHNGENPADFLSVPNEVKMVIDINYNNDKTELVKYCKKNSIPAYDGKLMLFHQAADAFEIWSEKKIYRKDALEEYLELK